VIEHVHGIGEVYRDGERVGKVAYTADLEDGEQNVIHPPERRTMLDGVITMLDASPLEAGGVIDLVCRDGRRFVVIIEERPSGGRQRVTGLSA